MSQYIQLPKSLPLQAPSILKGILSKVIQSSFSPKQTFKEPLNTKHDQKQYLLNSTQNLFKSQTQKRFIDQIKLADQLQHIVINKQYQSMKKNLSKYGRSKSSKIVNIIRDKKHSGYFGTQQSKQIPFKRNSQNGLNEQRNSIDSGILAMIKKQQKMAKLRYSIGNIYSSKDSHDRVVFVDRKYNNEFAIKRSSLMEMQEIQQRKQKYIKFISKYKKKQPLIQQANIKRRKYESYYQKQPLESIGIFKQVKNRAYSNMKNKQVISILESSSKNENKLIKNENKQLENQKIEIFTNKEVKQNINKNSYNKKYLLRKNKMKQCKIKNLQWKSNKQIINKNNS